MSVEGEARAANATFWQVFSQQEEEVEAEDAAAAGGNDGDDEQEGYDDARMSEGGKEDEPTTTDGGDHTAGDDTTTDGGDRTDGGRGNPAAKKKKKEREDRNPMVLAKTTDEITKPAANLQPPWARTHNRYRIADVHQPPPCGHPPSIYIRAPPTASLRVSKTRTIHRAISELLTMSSVSEFGDTSTSAAADPCPSCGSTGLVKCVEVDGTGMALVVMDGREALAELVRMDGGRRELRLLPSESFLDAGRRVHVVDVHGERGAFMLLVAVCLHDGTIASVREI
ncbi:hypothetical protein ACQ4PT_041512 [Festuca glaucescens]